MEKKLVSVIIPLYNAEKYISETLDSVRAQTYQNWECIIIDDGSTDSSKKIVSEYCKNDKRFIFHYQCNSGASAARNQGLKMSFGDYIQFLDADDVILPGKIKLMVDLYENLEDKIVLYCGALLGSHHNIREVIPFEFPLNLGHDVTFEECYKKYALDFVITPGCLLFPIAAIKGLYWKTELSSAEDWDFFLQVLYKDYIFRFIPQDLVLYRNTPLSSSKIKENLFKGCYRVLGSWINKNNLLAFISRSALLYKTSIFQFLLKKSERIFKPEFDTTKFKLHQKLLIILIYPLTFGYFLNDIIKILLKRGKRLIRKSNRG